MSEGRHSVTPTESLVEQHMKRCRRQPLLATNDVGYFHEMVVNDVGQMVGRQLVSTLV